MTIHSVAAYRATFMVMLPEPIKAVLRPVRNHMRGIARNLALQKLESCGVPNAAAIADAVRAAVAGSVSDPAFAIIEAERERLRQCKDPLVDGTLNPVWVIDQGKTVADACGVSIQSVYPQFLHRLALNLRARRAIELGTNIGISSSYIGSGLQRAGDGSQLLTLDASVYRQRIAQGIHAKIGLKNVTYAAGMFEDTLETAVQRLGEIDFAFIDGDHTYASTVKFFARFFESAKDHAVFVFDDIRWSQGMLDAWHEIEKDRRVAVSVDFDRIGLCIVSRKASGAPLNLKMHP